MAKRKTTVKAKAKTVKVTDPAKATAVFTCGKLRVTLRLDGGDNVMKQTAIEACRRLGHRLAAWSEVVRLAPRDAHSAERVAAMISESEAEIAGAVRLKVATVEVA